MIIYVDIDNTICRTHGTDYENAVPDTNAIHRINILFYRKHRIVYWTSRGVGSGKDLRPMTEQQLKKWGCLYHELRCDKPVYDLFIDDKTLNNISLVNTLDPDINLPNVKNFFPDQNYKKNKKYKFKQFYEYPILDIYKNKKICLLGCGSSLEKYNINFNDYDLIVGLNRIYMTKYFDNIDIFYNSLSFQDWKNIKNMIQILSTNNKLKQIIFSPWGLGKRKKRILYNILLKYNIQNYLYTNKIGRHITLKRIERIPITGMSVLYHILQCDSSSIDIYGFDFYQDPQNIYIQNIKPIKYKVNKYHNIGSNFDFFKTLLETHNNKIVWHQ